MIFEILAEKDGENRTFYYDNDNSTLTDANGFNIRDTTIGNTRTHSKEQVPFSKDVPMKKSKSIRHLKIQLGLSCNYSCEYCSQRFMERPPETSKKDIENFMRQLLVLDFGDDEELKIEFWGGEPLVYWKTLKPLTEALKEKFANRKVKPMFSMVTNGSLLTREICAWLYYNDFVVGLSHDGPGQYVRGPDPLDDPKQKEIILEFYNLMKPMGRFSFNCMINRHNQSRQAVYEWFAQLTGDPKVQIGEGGFIDAYDDAALANMLLTKQEHFDYRRRTFGETHVNGNALGFNLVYRKIDGFIKSTLANVNSKYVGQKCGMDEESTIAIDLKGNVVTCQNVSIIETSKNGESHLGGNLDNYDEVELRSATHWMNRKDCATCPVLHICRGSCMYLEGKHWDVTCDNAYSDGIAVFALGFVKMTNGFIPKEIKAPHLPLDRQDIWGTIYKHEEQPQRKIIPIKAVAHVTTQIDGVDIYAKPTMEN